MRPFLILQKEEEAPPALIGAYLRDAGLKVDLRLLHRGDPVPQSLDGHAAVIALGGDMNVGEEEEFPFLLDERLVLATALREAVPVLGVCLGAQQLATAAGGGVGRRDDEEVGWYPLGVSQADDLLVGIHPSTLVFQWRRYFCRLPQDAVTLVVREGEPQVFRLGDCAWGVQFHPEIDKPTVMAWLDGDPQAAGAAWPGGFKKLKKVTKRELYRSAMTCGLLMLNFLEASGARRRARGES